METYLFYTLKDPRFDLGIPIPKLFSSLTEIWKCAKYLVTNCI